MKPLRTHVAVVVVLFVLSAGACERKAPEPSAVTGLPLGRASSTPSFKVSLYTPPSPTRVDPP